MIRRLTGRKPRKPEFAGNCDGLVDGELHGWAWSPGAPQARVEVEQWVAGALVARTVADLPREDLLAAGIGDGAHGWRLPLALDPAAGAQRVELRFPDGEVLPNGTFQVAQAPAPAPAEEAEPPPLPPPPVWGQCDQREGERIHGWAWRPVVPEEHVVVEQWVDGALVAETLADVLRPDLVDAGVGHGRYGWVMRLMLDPAKTGPQVVDLRIKGDGPVAGGRFELALEELQGEAVEAAEASEVVGRCDGLKGAALYGWAWNPSQPDTSVEVELWIGEACVASAIADRFRPDLRANRIGHGRCGWRLPVDLSLAETAPVTVEVRAKGGAPLEGGVVEIRNDLTLEDPANAALRPFVDAVLNPGAPRPAATAPGITALLYCPAPTEAGRYWGREFDDYAAALQAFAPVLAGLGEALEVETLEAAEEICAERRRAGRDCVMFVFAPPRQAPLAAPCPIVPVFAWAFPTIPTGSWDGDPRSDWRRVLAFAGRAVTFSRFAAEAVRAAMGPDFPVAAIAPPVAAEAPPPKAPGRRRTIRLNGMVFDSRAHRFDPENPVLPPPVWTGEADAGAGREIEVEGVLTTAVLDLDDGRKNWRDLVSAFTAANREKADAVLLLKLAHSNAGWMQQLYKWLAAQPPFACRVLAVRGPLEGADHDRLIAASHWCVSAAKAEGLCLPMQDFLAAGRPAIAPAHTALADLLAPDTALLVDCDEEDWRWPPDDSDERGEWSWTQHPEDVGPTTRRRVSWSSLVAAFREAHRLATAAPEDYARLAAAAAERMRATASAEAALAAVRALLAQDAGAAVGPVPSPLMRDLAPA